MIIIWSSGTWCWEVDWKLYSKETELLTRMLVPDGMSDEEITDEVIEFLCGGESKLRELKLGGK